MSNTTISIGSLRLPTPFMLGSGPVGVRAEDLIVYGKVAGAIVTKSISLNPSRGSPQPRIVKLDRDGMINYEGGPNPGIDSFAETLRSVRAKIACPIIGSISPRTLARTLAIEHVTEKFIASGIDGLELDFKYLFDQDKGKMEFMPESVSSVIRRVRAVAEIPIVAKLALGSIPFDGLVSAVEDGGAAAISAINSVFPAMKIGLRTRRPVLSMNFGGLSGAPIRPLAVAAIFRLRQLTKLPLIGIGGVVEARDAAEFFMAGANAVQVYTAAQVKGPSIFTELNGALTDLLSKLKVANLAEIVGTAHAPSTREHNDHQWDAIAE